MSLLDKLFGSKPVYTRCINCDKEYEVEFVGMFRTSPRVCSLSCSQEVMRTLPPQPITEVSATAETQGRDKQREREEKKSIVKESIREVMEERDV